MNWKKTNLIARPAASATLATQAKSAMWATLATLGTLAVALTALLGCQSRTDRTDGGGVLLSVSQLSMPPTQFILPKMPTPGMLLPSITSVTIQNLVKDPTPTSTSMLENVELNEYEVIYTRADSGTRVPPPLIENFGGVVPVNGTLLISNLAILANNQVDTLPISDIAQYGVDRETNSTIIVLNVSIIFFGKTLSGQAVQTTPSGFTMEVFQQ
jgi:hypothetical protein